MKGSNGSSGMGARGRARPGWSNRLVYALGILTVTRAFDLPQQNQQTGNAVCQTIQGQSPGTTCCQAIQSQWTNCAVTCTADSAGVFITGLTLAGCGLMGQVDATLGNNLFSKITKLDLSNNQLTGVIPPIVFQTSLTYLDLSRNQFSGNVPSAIFTSSVSLQTLKLASNRFTGGLGAGILGNLSQLKTLDVSFNQQLQIAIPAALGSLPNLKSLDLQNCGFIGPIPNSLGNLANLQNLNLGNNQLTGTIPGQVIRNLQNLNQLNLSNQGNCGQSVKSTSSSNCLGGTIPTEIGRLGSLQVLDLSGNRLSGSIPSQIQKAVKLRQVYLGGNKLSGNLPATLSVLLKLSYLDLSNNKLSGTIPTSFSALSALTWLNLSNNFQLAGSVGCSTITQPSTPMFYSGGATDINGNALPPVLSHVDVSNNAMDGSLCGTQLNQIISLQYLDVGSNSLTGQIPSFANLATLTYLNLANNQFKGNIPSFASQNIHVLKIAGNPSLSCSGLVNYGTWASSLNDFAPYYGQTCPNCQTAQCTGCATYTNQHCGQAAPVNCPRKGSFPSTPAGKLATGSCTPGYTGKISKMCKTDGTWDRQTMMQCRQGCSQHQDCNTGANSHGGVSRGPQFCFSCAKCLLQNQPSACGSCNSPKTPKGECQSLSLCTVGAGTLYQSINGFCPGTCPLRGSWPVSTRGQTVRNSCPSGYIGQRIRRCLQTGLWERRIQYNCVKGCNANSDCSPSQYCMSCSKCLGHKNQQRCATCGTSQHKVAAVGECQALTQCVSRYTAGKGDSTNTGGTCPGGCPQKAGWPATQAGQTASITCAQGGNIGWTGTKTRKCLATKQWARSSSSNCVRGCKTHNDCSASQYCMICSKCLANYPVSATMTLAQQATKCGGCATYQTQDPMECGTISQCVKEATAGNNGIAVGGVCPHYCPSMPSHIGNSVWPMTRIGATTRLPCQTGYFGDIMRKCAATTQTGVGGWGRNQYHCRKGGASVATPGKLSGFKCAWQAGGHNFYLGGLSGGTKKILSTGNSTVLYQLSMCSNGHTECTNAGLAMATSNKGNPVSCLSNLGSWANSGVGGPRADTPVGHYKDSDGMRLLFNNGQTCMQPTNDVTSIGREVQTNTIVNFICQMKAKINTIQSVRARQTGPCNYVFDVYTKCACNNGCPPASGLGSNGGPGSKSSGSSAGVAILIFLIIAIIGVAAYFYYKKSMLEKEMFELEYAKMGGAGTGDSSNQA